MRKFSKLSTRWLRLLQDSKKMLWPVPCAGRSGGQRLSHRNITCAVCICLPLAGAFAYFAFFNSVMLYDRAYMRQPAYSDRERPWLLWIIGTVLAGSVVQFVLQVWFANVSFWNGWVAASVDNLFSGKVWTLLTYGLGHNGLMHLLFNLLTIFFVGRVLQTLVRQKDILICFIASVVLGAVIWLLVHIAAGPALLIGASAGSLGLLTLFCSLRPNQQISLLLFFVFPVTLKPKWIVWAVVAFNGFGMLFAEMPRAFNVSEGMAMGPTAFSAHLGGVLAGFLYARYLQRPVPMRSAAQKKGGVKIEMPEWMRSKRSRAAASIAGRYQVNVSSSRPSGAAAQETATPSAPPTTAEVDRVLDKINREGFGSLSEQERQVLERAGERSRR